MSSVFDRMLSQANGSGRDIPPLDSEPSSSAPNGRVSVEYAPSTLLEAKKATQELLKYGYLEEAESPELFRTIIIQGNRIKTILEPLDLELRLDDHRGIAFLSVAQSAYGDADDGGAWTHPLIRRQRLTLEQSLVAALLRQAFVIHEQEAGVGRGPFKIAVDELLPQFLTYFGDSGSDAKNESRLLNLLDQLKPHGIVSEVDKNQEVAIRPLIAYLADPESLGALLRALQAQGRPIQSTELKE